MHKQLRMRTIAVALTALLACTGSVRAQQDGTWTANSAGNWNDTAKWLNSAVANGAGRTANISANITGARVITNNIAVTLGTLNMGDSNDSHAYTLQLTTGGALTFDSGNNTGAFLNFYSTSRGDTISADFTVADAGGLVLNNASGRDSTLSGIITGSGLVVSNAGAGAISLTRANAITGDLAIRRGRLSVADAGALGTAQILLGSTNGSADATLNSAKAYSSTPANSVTNAITVVGGNTGVATISGSVAVGGGHFSGPVTLDNHDLAVTTVGTSGNAGVTLAGGITGTGNVTVATGNTGSGAVITLSGAAVNMKGTLVNQGTTVNSSVSLTALIGANVQRVIQDSSLSIMTFGNGANAFAGGVLVRKGQINANGAGTLGLGVLTLGDDSFPNSHTVHFGNGSGALPSNDIVLGDRSAYTGRIQIGPGAGNGPTYSGGISGSNDVVLTASAAASSGAFTLSGSINHNGSLANESPSSGRFTITGVIGTNVTSFTQNSSTSVTRLSNANTFKGAATVSSGTLEINHVNALQNATLDTGVAGDQQAAFIVSGTQAYNLGGLAGGDDLSVGANSLTVGSNGASTTYSGAILGTTGSLAKVGDGTLFLDGESTFTGTTTVTAGRIGGNGSIGGDLVINGGGFAAQMGSTLHVAGDVNLSATDSGIVMSGAQPLSGRLVILTYAGERAGAFDSVEGGLLVDYSVAGEIAIQRTGGTVILVR